MKVILLKDVRGQGKEGDVVNISDGYARNFLFPRKLAKAADAASLNAIRNRASAQKHKKAEEETVARELAKSLRGAIVEVKVHAGEQGRLFGSVSNMEVAKAISEQMGTVIDRRKIIIKTPIKSIGLYTVTAKIYAGISTEIKVNIIADS